YESALHTDAILLIAKCLTQNELADFHALATEYGLDVLVEVFDEDDVEKIQPYHFPLIGINNRDLQTMKVDLGRSNKMISLLDAGQTVVAASGVRSRHDVSQMMSAGIRSFLIGESLAINSNRISFLKELRGMPNDY
ncbi:MAG: hypothetical protein ACRC2T_11665, partial [Thermoguttaceae bacterium]